MSGFNFLEFRRDLCREVKRSAGDRKNILFAAMMLFLLIPGAYSQKKKIEYHLGKQLVPNVYQVPASERYLTMPAMTNPVTDNLNTACTNSNFVLGNWTGWTGCYGYGVSAPLPSCQTSGMLLGPPYPPNYTVPLHKMMQGPGYNDYYGCGVVKTVFPGESFSARIGDTTTGRHGAELHYEITVGNQNYLFVYRYAVVLESPGHDSTAQPNFQVVIRDSLNNALDSTCGFYYIAAPKNGGVTIPGWTFCSTYGKPRYARPWTTVGMDLTPYLGQRIILAFIAKGCAVSGGSHRGYAFVSAYCSAMTIQTALCQGDTSATLTAPPGFAHYQWSTGDTTTSITVPNPVTGASYSCTLTAYNNCQVMLTMNLTYTVVTANFTYTPACPGSPTLFSDSSVLNQNEVISWDWNWGDGTPGNTVAVASTTHIFANPGTYNVTMIAHSTEGCVDTVTKSVTIDSLALVTNSPMLKSLCSGQSVNLSITSNVAGAGFTWTVVPQHPATTTGYHNNTVFRTFLNDTLYNAALVPDTVQYLLAPHNLSCTSPDTIFRVVVLPKPALANTVLSQHVCTGSSTTPVTLVPQPGPPAVVTFNWTAYPSSPLLTGYTPSATGSLLLPAQAIVNPTGVQQSVTDSITPILQAANACVGDKKAYRYYVNPFPVPAISGAASVCANATGVVYSTPAVANHEYLWMVTGAAGYTGGTTNSVTVNWGAGPAGTLTVQETDKSYPSGCSKTTPAYTVTINPNPSPVITGNQNPCGLSLQNYTLVNPQSSHVYAWTVSGGTPATGSGTGISVTWGNTNPAGISVTETIHYGGNVSCSKQSPAFPVSLTLVPLAAGSISGLTPVCHTWSEQYSVAPVTNADSYTWWYVPSGGVTITNNGVTAGLAFDATSSSGNLYVKGNRTGCPSGQASPAFPIRVNPLPVVTLTSCNDPKTTTSARPFYLKGGLPAGGDYYLDGNLVTGGLITPSALPPTVHHITYRYTNVNTCEAISSAVNLTILPGSNLTSCPGTFTDPRNSRVYHASLIGGRCWMLENLDYGAKLSPETTSQTDNCVVEKYCTSLDASCAAYGGLYQWDELMQYRLPPAGGYLQGLCPPEWHVPTADEWQQLIEMQIPPGNGLAGGALKDPAPAAGFKALLDGIYYQNQTWDYTAGSLTSTFFWTATPAGGNRIVTRAMNNYNTSVSSYNSLRSNAFPVRCVKDY